MSKLVSALCQIFNIKCAMTSSWHAQTNGKCEHYNSIIAQFLRAYVDEDQSNWPDLIPSIMMAFSIYIPQAIPLWFLNDVLI